MSFLNDFYNYFSILERQSVDTVFILGLETVWLVALSQVF